MANNILGITVEVYELPQHLSSAATDIFISYTHRTEMDLELTKVWKNKIAEKLEASKEAFTNVDVSAQRSQK